MDYSARTPLVLNPPLNVTRVIDEESAEKLLVSGGLLPHTSAGPGAAGVTGLAQIGERRPRASAGPASGGRVRAGVLRGRRPEPARHPNPSDVTQQRSQVSGAAGPTPLT